MKKPIALLLLVLAAGLVWWALRTEQISREKIAPGTVEPSARQTAAQAIDRNAEHAIETGELKQGFASAASALERGVAQNDPVAIDKFVGLVGACNTAQSVKPSIAPRPDMVKLQRFCSSYSPTLLGQSYGDWVSQMHPRSESELLSQRMEAIRAAGGDQALAKQLLADARDADPYKAKLALEYAADATVAPEGLTKYLVPTREDNFFQSLRVLAQLHYCRRATDCGPNGFETLRACVAIGPCRQGESVVELIRRNTSPDIYQTAIQMESSL